MAILINPLNISVVSPRMWAGSSARLERSTDNRKVAGSNPARPTIALFGFSVFLPQRNVLAILTSVKDFPLMILELVFRLICHSQTRVNAPFSREFFLG